MANRDRLYQGEGLPKDALPKPDPIDDDPPFYPNTVRTFSHEFCSTGAPPEPPRVEAERNVPWRNEKAGYRIGLVGLAELG